MMMIHQVKNTKEVQNKQMIRLKENPSHVNS